MKQGGFNKALKNRFLKKSVGEILNEQYKVTKICKACHKLHYDFHKKCKECRS